MDMRTLEAGQYCFVVSADWLWMDHKTGVKHITLTLEEVPHGGHQEIVITRNGFYPFTLKNHANIILSSEIKTEANSEDDINQYDWINCDIVSLEDCLPDITGSTDKPFAE